MTSRRTIITVCTANICRSPMAAALLQHALAAQEEPLRSLQVISAGVAAHDGEPVSQNSIQALRKVGIDVSAHRSQMLTPKMANEALAIFCMTETHRARIQMAVRPAPKHLHLFREFLPKGADKEIGDPFGGSLKLYESCRDEMVEAIPSLVEFLRRLCAEET
jgi:protein-tyrosine phosphatase